MKTIKDFDEPTIPKDINLKIGTAEEAAWERIKFTQEESLRNAKINIEISEKVLELSELRIAEEKERWKRMGKNQKT